MFFDIGSPKRVMFEDWNDALKYINKNIYLTNLYYTVYKYTKLLSAGKIDYSSCIIDKLFFDFDDKNSCVTDSRKLHEFLMKENIKHSLYLSGKGIHIIILTKVEDIKNKKAAILQAQKYFIDKLGLNVDKQTLGDTARLRRIPNTFNFRSKRFCVPITGEELLSLNLDDIYCLGHKQRINIENLNGKELFDISQFDKELDFSKEIDEITHTVDVSSNENTIFLVNGTNKQIEMLPFLMKILDESKNKWEKEMGHWNRANLILWMFYQGLTPGEVKSVMKEYLTPEEFSHMEVMERQVNYLWKRLPMNNFINPMLFPNVVTLLAKGYKLNSKDVEMIEELKERDNDL